MTDIDDFDRRIIAALSRNARASNLELQEEVKLSHSAISRRIARLE
ncbi:MAG: Lrp/AsnC family transcriptional regulator, partial [Beijerinckiaceae bacterium]